MLLILDNYDSFTYNLVHYLEELGAATKVVRNDELTVAAAVALAPERIVISPGPRRPRPSRNFVCASRAVGRCDSHFGRFV